jgi:chromosome partitioning protein
VIRVAVVNQKGGSGKTTTTAAIGAALRERGRFVSLLDTDPQGTLALLAPGVEQADLKTLPRMLRERAGLDYVLIDSPPALGEVIRAATDAADAIIVPTKPEYLGLRGLGNLLEAIDTAKLLGFVIIGYRGHTKHHRRVLEKIGGFGYPVLATVPFSIAASDAGLVGKDVVSYAPARARGVAAAYRDVAEAIERWARTI